MKRKNEIDKESLNDLIHLSKNLLKITYVIVIVGVILGILIVFKQLKFFSFIGGVLKVISPLFIGFCISWLVYPLHKKLVKKGLNKVLSSILIFLVIVLIIFLTIYLFIPVLYKQVNDLIGHLPNILSSITEFVTSRMNRIDIKGIDLDSIKTSIISAGEKGIVSFTSSIPNSIVGFVKGLFSAVGIVLISLVVGIYMLIDFEGLLKGMQKLLPKNSREDYIRLFKNIDINARRVVNGTLLVAFLVFVFDTIGFTIIGLDASVLFGLFCGITDLIPYIGPYIGGAAAVIVGFTQSPIIGIGALIIAIVVQILESYVLQPMVMSKAMQLHPVTIIVGLLLFGYFFGIIGMIIATPCMAIIKEIILFINSKRKNLRKI